MNVSLRHLRAFAAIAGAGNFTTAAKQLHVSQSALSVLMKDLEDDLGVSLLVRTTRNVRVLEVGQAFLPQIMRVLEDLEHAIHSIADLRDLKRGVARIAAPQLISVTLVPAVLAAHRPCFLGVEVRIVECLMEEVETKVASGETDLGVGPERAVGPEVETILLMKLPVMLVFPKRHPLATARRVTWSDVVAQPFIAQHGSYRADRSRPAQLVAGAQTQSRPRSHLPHDRAGPDQQRSGGDRVSAPRAQAGRFVRSGDAADRESQDGAPLLRVPAA